LIHFDYGQFSSASFAKGRDLGEHLGTARSNAAQRRGRDPGLPPDGFPKFRLAHPDKNVNERATTAGAVANIMAGGERQLQWQRAGGHAEIRRGANRSPGTSPALGFGGKNQR